MTDTPLHLSSPDFLKNLTPDVVLALSADWRDRLIHYLRIWGDGEQLLSIVTTLREVHGATLPLMDHEASGLARLDKHGEALKIVERRLRRSPALAAVAFEVELLQAAGHVEHAQEAARELLRTYPDNVTAVSTAATVLAADGHFSEAWSALESVTAKHEGDVRIALTLTEVALQSTQEHLAGEVLQRLGAGIPSDINDDELLRLANLHQALGNTQSADAAQIELERRRRTCFDDLLTLLVPLSKLPPTELMTSDLAYEQLTGNDTFPVSKTERRQITLETARYFGFSEFREGQIETIAAVLRDESVLVVMPTGAGKSLCYQLPALVREGTTLVISPLIALMKDQVENLPTAERRRATFINSTLSDEQMEERMQAVAAGHYKLVYAAPERLRHLTFLHTLRCADVSLFVVDEAHCVSLWGHDFRPDYLFLQAALSELGNPPALAMTATAPPRVRDEILDTISSAGDNSDSVATGRQPPRVLTLDVFRDNLHLSTLRFNSDEEKLAAATGFVSETDGSGIVYVNSRRMCESVAYALRLADVSAEAYHAGLENRADVQDRFMSGQTRVIVATIAFGMGIDKPDIRFIIHFHPPRSLASYYQEVGRAGRDGKPSQGVLFYSSNDWSNLRRWAKSDEYSVEFLENVYLSVASQLDVDIPSNPTSTVPTHHDLEPRSDNRSLISGPVDAKRIQAVLNVDETSVRVALSTLERVGLLYRDFDVPDIVEITQTQPSSTEQVVDAAFQTLCTGLCLKQNQHANFKLIDIATFMGWRLEEVENRLLAMEQAGLIRARFERRRMLLHLAEPPADFRERLERLRLHNAAVSQRRIDDVISYATSDRCRHGVIGAYLGSRPISSCDVCDNCTGIRPNIAEPEALPQLDLSDAEIAAVIVDCLVSLPKAVGRHGLARVLVGSLRSPVPADDARHFGSLRSLGENAVVQGIDGLLSANHLRQYDRNGYPLLSATLSGRSLAQSWRDTHPDDTPRPDTAAKQQDDSMGELLPPESSTSDRPRYTKLQTAIWAWRRRSAEEQRRPPYTIMDNSLILAIAEARPTTTDELAAIPGIGHQRLDRYGPILLDLVRLHPPQEGDEAILVEQRAEPSDGTVQERTTRTQNTAVSLHVARAVFLKLQEIRQRQAVSEGCSPSSIANSRLLHAISGAAPTSVEQLMAVNGFRSSGLVDHVETILMEIRDALDNEYPEAKTHP